MRDRAHGGPWGNGDMGWRAEFSSWWPWALAGDLLVTCWAIPCLPGGSTPVVPGACGGSWCGGDNLSSMTQIISPQSGLRSLAALAFLPEETTTIRASVHCARHAVAPVLGRYLALVCPSQTSTIDPGVYFGRHTRHNDPDPELISLRSECVGAGGSPQTPTGCTRCGGAIPAAPSNPNPRILGSLWLACLSQARQGPSRWAATLWGRKKGR